MYENQHILDTLYLMNMKCECNSKMFQVKECDGSIICQNCKREYDLKLTIKEII